MSCYCDNIPCECIFMWELMHGLTHKALCASKKGSLDYAFRFFPDQPSADICAEIEKEDESFFSIVSTFYYKDKLCCVKFLEVPDGMDIEKYPAFFNDKVRLNGKYGHFCGYAYYDPHEIGCLESEEIDYYVCVHGGVTFRTQERFCGKDMYVIGFDCAHHMSSEVYNCISVVSIETMRMVDSADYVISQKLKGLDLEEENE